jgi:hypothetical protein
MKKNTIIFGLCFVLLIALGIVFNNGILNEKETITTEKFVELLVPRIEYNKIKEEATTFLTENDTTITKKYNVYKGDEVVAIVYFGKTKGYKDNLEVAFGIDVKKNIIVGMEIVSSQETEAFLKALNRDSFEQQFKSKDLTKFALEVQIISGATPNGGNGDIAPFTSAGIQKVMLLARKQYSKDTGFVMPLGLEVVSKSLDYKKIDQYNYVLKLEETVINVVVNKDYEIVTISDETHRAAALETIKKDKVIHYIDDVKVEGNTTTLKINAKGYETSRIKTTVIITDNVIVSVNLTYTEEQTFEYAPDYTTGDYENAPNQIENGESITAVTGATRTYEGLTATQQILKAYMEANK